MTEGEFQKQLKKYHEAGEMPVELAIKLLSECAMDCVYDEETEEAKFMAIKALEQEPILDKIRAEIDLETRIQVKHYTNTDDVIDAVLDVIGEYKAESEDKE